MIILYKVLNKLLDLWENYKHETYIKICRHNGLKLGTNAIIRRNVNFGSEPFLIEIGDDSRIASGTTFVNHSGAAVNLRKLEGYSEVRNFGKIKIGKNCAVGVNCVILSDVQVGNNCILGANSVLSESMPDNTVYAGNPAKYVCEIEDYGDVMLKTTIHYPIELEKNRKQLNKWLKINLPEKYKVSK